MPSAVSENSPQLLSKIRIPRSIDDYQFFSLSVFYYFKDDAACLARDKYVLLNNPA